MDWAYDDYDIDNYGDTDRRHWSMETMQIGAFAQGRFEFDNGIDLSTGLRLDHHRFTDWNGDRLTDTGASANSTVSYEFAEGYEIFAGGSRTWLGYDIGEYGLLHARDSGFGVAQNYEPASATNVKLGLNANQGNWTGNLTFFDTRLKDLAEYDTGDAYALVNADEYRSKGFTLQGNYSWGSGRVGASFTKADVTQNGQDLLPQGGTVVPVGELATLFVDQEIPQYNLKVGDTVEVMVERIENACGLVLCGGHAGMGGHAVERRHDRGRFLGPRLLYRGQCLWRMAAAELPEHRGASERGQPVRRNLLRAFELCRLQPARRPPALRAGPHRHPGREDGFLIHRCRRTKERAS